MAYSISTAAISNIGKVRTNNEDNLLYLGNVLEQTNKGLSLQNREFISDRPELLGVFDGMGGTAAGELASYLTASVAKNIRDNKLADTNVEKCLLAVCNQANDKVCREMVDNIKGRMGTTAVMACFADENLFLCNIGDSPAFLLRNGKLSKISVDHTEQTMYENIYGKQQEHKKYKLTQHIGIFADELVIEPFCKSFQLLSNDVILLCSDGLTDMVSEERLAALLGDDKPIAAKVQSLLDEALANGGKDNTTIIACQIGDRVAAAAKTVDAAGQTKVAFDDMEDTLTVEQMMTAAGEAASESDSETESSLMNENQERTVISGQKPLASKTSQINSRHNKSQAHTVEHQPPRKKGKGKLIFGLLIAAALMLCAAVFVTSMLKHDENIEPEQIPQPPVADQTGSQPDPESNNSTLPEGSFEYEGVEYYGNGNGTAIVTGYDEEKLTGYIDLTNAQYSGKKITVSAIGEDAFADCSQLTDIVIPATVTSIGEGAFDGCTKLTSVAITDSPETSSQLTSIGARAFRKCSSLSDIMLPDSITAIGKKAFINCSSLNIDIPERVESIGESAFAGCSSLQNMTILSSVTSLGSYAFADCGQLQTIQMNGTLKDIADGAFKNCQNLFQVKIADSVTSIGDYAFYGCNQLTEITLPANIQIIGAKAFGGSYLALKVNFRGGPPQKIVEADNDDASFAEEYTTLYYPSGQAGVWKTEITPGTEKIWGYKCLQQGTSDNNSGYVPPGGEG